MLRFVRLAPHSLPTGGRCAQGVSARASSKPFRRRVSLGLSHSFGNFRAQKTRGERIHTLQASQNELAEPFKYSNTVRTSSTFVCCIPSRSAIGDGKATSVFHEIASPQRISPVVGEDRRYRRRATTQPESPHFSSVFSFDRRAEPDQNEPTREPSRFCPRILADSARLIPHRSGAPEV